MFEILWENPVVDTLQDVFGVANKTVCDITGLGYNCNAFTPTRQVVRRAPPGSKPVAAPMRVAAPSSVTATAAPRGFVRNIRG